MLSRLIYKPVKFSLDLTAVLKDDYLRQIKIREKAAPWEVTVRSIMKVCDVKRTCWCLVSRRTSID